MVGLARETHWSEDYIRDILPLARLRLYQHAAIRQSGFMTKIPGDSVDDQLAILDMED